MRHAQRPLATLAFIALVMTEIVRVDARPAADGFAWPRGYRAAISLSFDDARESQLDNGRAALRRNGHKGHVLSDRQQSGDPRDRLEKGCRRRPRTRQPLDDSSLQRQLRVVALACPRRFHAGSDASGAERRHARDRGRHRRATGDVRVSLRTDVCGTRPDDASYAPLVSELFIAGRLWLSEAPNDPAYVDLAQLFGYPMDDVDFSALEPIVRDTIDRGQWLVLAGHDIGQQPGKQVTRVETLHALTRYLRERRQTVWVDTVGAIAKYVQRARPFVRGPEL